MEFKGGNEDKSGNQLNPQPQLGFKEREKPLQRREWYSRDYLPHRNQLNLKQHITFRLADSLPKSKLRELEYEKIIWKRRAADDPNMSREMPESEQRKRIEDLLDAGLGCCALKHPEIANVVQETLLKFDNSRYHLFAWCNMPNHVHVLIEPLSELGKIMQSWKSYTGKWGCG